MKLRLPQAVTDDHTLLERQAEKRGELGRHCSDSHDRRPIASHGGALRLAGNPEPFESGALACKREILFVGNRTGFAVRVAAEQRNEPVSLCEGRVANNQPAHEAVHGRIAANPQGNRQQQRGSQAGRAQKTSRRIAEIGRETHECAGCQEYATRR